MKHADEARTFSVPIGVRWAILAAILFGSTTPIAKVLISEMSPVTLAAMFYLGSGIGLMIARAIRNSSKDEAPIGKGDYPWLAGAVVFGGVFGPILLMVGLKTSTASTTSLLLNLEGVFTALIAWLAFRENYDKRIAIGMLLIVIGSLVLSWQENSGAILSWGAIAIIGACLCWGIDNNLTQKVSCRDPFQVASIKGLVAGCVNLSISVVLGLSQPAPEKAFIAMIVGFLGYGLSLAFFVMALRHIGTARTGAYFSLAPFWGMLMSVAFLQDEVTVQLLTAGAFMAGGMWIHLTESHEHAHHHEKMSHDHRHTHDEHHNHTHDRQVEPGSEHSHDHVHGKLVHEHPHFPDTHHRHSHDNHDCHSNHDCHGNHGNQET
ncbi:MAG: EamA family transporter [Candidatus Ozemobacteraceae bacterium]